MIEERKSVPNRLAGITLAAWSALLLQFYLSGRLHAYLAPSFRPYILVAGLVLASMALILLIAGGELHACPDDSCSHIMRPGKQWTCFVLLIPVLLAAIAGDNQTFSAQMVTNRNEVTDIGELASKPRYRSARRIAVDALFPMPVQDGEVAPSEGGDDAELEDWLPRTAAGHIQVEVLDLLFSLEDEEMRGEFEGKTVSFTGQILPVKAKQIHSKRFKAMRMLMTCCAADARPASVVIESNQIPAFPEMTWVEIVGEATFPIENGKRIPLLLARSITPCPPPKETFVFDR